MKTNYFKLVLIIMFAFMSLISFGQVKQISLPNIVSPPKTSKVLGQGMISKSVSTKDTIKQKEEFDFHSEKGIITIKFNEKSETKATDFFQGFSRKLEINNDDSFTLIKSEIDNIGITHYRYQQNYKNIPVNGVQFLLHEKNGKLNSANGNFYSGLSLNTTPSISEQDAIQKAIDFVGAEKYLWNNKDEEDFHKKEKNDNNATYYPKAVLVIAPIDGIYRKENFKLCYKVNIFSELPYDNVDVYIDAQTGKAINKIGKIAHADVVGTANTLYSGTKTITMDNNAGTYRLRETTRPIQTFNMKNGTNYSGAVDFTNTTNNWNSQEVVLESVTISTVNNNWEDLLGEKISNGGAPDIFIEIRDANNTLIWTKVNNVNGLNVSAYYENTFPVITINTGKLVLLNGPYTLKIYDDDVTSTDDLLGTFTFNAVSGIGTFSASGTSGSISRSSRNNPGLDAHWAMEKTYDFYLNQLQRNSFDNAGGLIKNYVHTGISYNNATWNGSAMSYGDGDGQKFTPLTSIDVVGHEFSHAVVEYTADLYYQNESGALNESFGDIFGTAIEFYGTTNLNWNIGELIVPQSPFFLRSMSNPKLKNHPNTWQGDNWAPLISSTYPSIPQDCTNDCGGVHTNSGVQNFWFYLLSQGGSGTIDDAGTTPYSVTGIGITKATKIAYQNLAYHLNPISNYLSAYNNSLLAVEELYPTVGGIHSPEYNSVRQAWYAVGLGSNPISSCNGTTELIANSGTFSDGSGNTNYSDNASCKWVIKPAGATQISLNFTAFNTESGYDKVSIYNGDTDNPANLIIEFSGTSIPSTVTTNLGIGAMCVKYTTDSTTNYSGWTANYNSIITTPACSGLTTITNPTGTFGDGSGANNYTNNQKCYWYISPPCATSVTLSFSQLNIENGYDFVQVYDSLSATNQIGLPYTGNTLPASVTSNTGVMLVVFSSDFTNTSQGFTANYTSTGSSYCTGVTTLNTSDYGTISDGSGANTYCNNSNCSWLIQPPNATGVTLNFTAFDLEEPSTDGNSIYDVVEVYDGTSASGTLLGRFTGGNIPSAISSSGGSMFVKFTSDISDTYQGWSAYYTSTQNSYCNSSSSTLTAPSGTFTDGSGTNKYANNSNCSWLIQPPSATSITLSFTSFDTELDYDGVIVYDGVNSSATILDQFTGSAIPSSLTSTSGSMFVVFLSDEYIRANGWNASYTSTTIPQTVISQVYGGGGNAGGSSFTNDFIELFNRGTVAQDLTGWSVQYAATAGTSWTVQPLAARTLQPGQYYLIQCAAGTTPSTSLPTADSLPVPPAVGLPISNSNGKVILVSNTTAETTANPTGSQIIDKVGYGTTPNGYEGSGPTGALLSNTTAAFRKLNGCTDTDSNPNDFEVKQPNPRNSATPFGTCSNLSVSQNTLETVTLYPNPTNSKVFFNNINTAFKEVVIYNYLGQEVTKVNFTSTSSNQEIDMSTLAPGVYVLKFSDLKTRKTAKIIKQ
ncbi:CUB domain-containing protein [Flavobacterium sp.]|uniref:CUB domain-containing protein n=1 Tax=Flavobacterium sp. TaxID=239 RepID=UPI003BE27283